MNGFENPQKPYPEDPTGKVAWGAYAQVMNEWALAAPSWAWQHPRRAFAVEIIRAVKQTIVAASIVPYWPTPPAFEGSTVYESPNPRAILDEKLRATPLRVKNDNPHEVRVVFASQGQSRRHHTEPSLVYPNLPEKEVSQRSRDAATKLCRLVMDGSYTLTPHELELPVLLSRSSGGLAICSVVPVLSQNVRLQGGEPKAYVALLEEFLRGQARRAQESFDGLPYKSAGDELDFFGTSWQSIREAFKQNFPPSR